MDAVNGRLRIWRSSATTVRKTVSLWTPPANSMRGHSAYISFPSPRLKSLRAPFIQSYEPCPAPKEAVETPRLCLEAEFLLVDADRSRGIIA
jgi:hypothetical protein